MRQRETPWRERRAGALAVIFLLFALAGGARIAHSAPPPGDAGEFRDYYQSLRQPLSNLGCCSIADCRHLPWRSSSTAESGYEVMVPSRLDTAGTWQVVPLKVVVHRENPTGDAITCVWGGEIRCFVPLPQI